MRIRSLAGVIAGLVPLIIILVIIRQLTTGNLMPVIAVFMSAVLAFQVVAYGLLRSPRYRAGMFLSVTSVYLSLFGFIYLEESIELANETIPYLVLPTLLGSLVYRLRVTMLSFLLTLAGIALIPVFRQDSYQMNWNAFQFVLLTSLLILVVTHMRSQYQKQIHKQASIVADSEARYRQLFETIPGGILVHEHERIIDCNLAFAAMVGLSREEVIGRKSTEFVSPESAHKLREILPIEGEIEYEVLARRANGSTFPVEIISKPFTFREEQYRMLVVRDVSQIRQMMAALRTSREHLLTVVTNAPLILYTLDRRGVYTFAKGKALAALGRTSEEVVGRSIYEVFAGHDVLLDKATAVLNGDLSHDVSMEVEFRGQVFDTRFGPMLDDSNNLIGLTGVAINITDRVQIEEQLKITRQRLEMAVEAAGVGVWEFNLPGSELYISTELSQLLGYSAEEVAHNGELWGKLLYPADVAAFSDIVRNYHQHNQRRDFELEHRLVTRTGLTRWVLTRGSFVKEKGESRLIGTTVDITERKETARQLMELALKRERVELLERFISDLSHDFRTPLSVIRSKLFLIRNVEQADKRDQHVGAIELQIQRLDLMIDDLLNIARLENAPVQLAMQRCNLNSLVKELVEAQFPLAQQKQHTLRSEIQSDMLPVQVDMVQISRAINNVLVNALNYTPDGGQVTVRCRRVNSSAVIDVADSGIGIHPDETERIFERFYRAETWRPANTGGTGLGLAITRRVLEAHGGQISVESTPGEGSTFHIQLPIAKDTASPSSGEG
jgi:PAS domain S-box-containing protein